MTNQICLCMVENKNTGLKITIECTVANRLRITFLNYQTNSTYLKNHQLTQLIWRKKACFQNNQNGMKIHTANT